MLGVAPHCVKSSAAAAAHYLAILLCTLRLSPDPRYHRCHPAAKRRYLRGPNAEAAAQQRTAGADDGAAAALGAAKGAALAQAVYGDSSEDDFK